MADQPGKAGSNDDQSAQDSKSPVDQLIELLVYAPVGLAYDYGDVLPQLIKRGKSQVQLAKVMGQMAAQQGQSKAKQGTEGVDDVVNEVVLQAASVVAKGLTELGQLIGLAPESVSDESASDEPLSDEPDSSQPVASSSNHDSSDTSSDGIVLGPIAGYDDLTARQIVPLLSELDGAQRDSVRAYELASRARKTILGRLDQLDKSGA